MTVNKIGNSKYITKFDLLKGFWQIPRTERVKEISAFVTPGGLYHYKVMPFGMKNSPATFQRLINTIIAGIEHCEAYFNYRNKALTAKLLRQGYRYFKLREAFSKFYRRHSALLEKYSVSLKTLLQQGVSEPELYGD